jgi:two-component system NtrC family sensor kinase
MTIRKRVAILIVAQASLILIISVSVYFSFRVVSSRMQVIEKIDDLNINFLRMRMLEKNYFLYRDHQALEELIGKAEEGYNKIKSSEYNLDYILGETTYNKMLKISYNYLNMTRGLKKGPLFAPDSENRLREIGHELDELSALTLKKEREDVNKIINHNVIKVIISLGVIFLVQLIFWQYFWHIIIRDLTRMKELIRMVSEGNIHEVAVKKIVSGSEIYLAMRAISDMAKELEKREVELLQAKKLASLGVIIAGVAHELGNPLNNIAMLGQAYLSIYDMLGDEEKKIYMGDVLNQTERIRKIIQNLLDFSRQKKPALEEISPKEVVARSIELVSNQLKISNVKLHLKVPDGLPNIYVDASQLEQVLVNLYVNSIQAMPSGGNLFISLYNDRRGERLVMTVRDTGTGISQEIIANIFDPFFSTKGTKGTGLGLSVSYGIIKEHHGEISVESQEGEGTTFVIKLPVYKKEGGHHAKENYRD